MAETMIDSSVFRYSHTIHDISADECRDWLASPVTKTLISEFDRLRIAVALQFGDDSNVAVLHLIGPFDIRQAIIDRQKREQ